MLATPRPKTAKKLKVAMAGHTNTIRMVRTFIDDLAIKVSDELDAQVLAGHCRSAYTTEVEGALEEMFGDLSILERRFTQLSKKLEGL